MNETFEEVRDRMFMADPDSLCIVANRFSSLNGVPAWIAHINIVFKGKDTHLFWKCGDDSLAMAKHEAKCLMRLMLTDNYDP